MKRLIDLIKLDRLDHLIRGKATGSPKELAKRLGLSRSSLFELISFLRIEMDAPIRYDQYSCSYEYKYVPKFHLNFERDRINRSERHNITGGSEGNEDTDNNPDDENFIIKK